MLRFPINKSSRVSLHCLSILMISLLIGCSDQDGSATQAVEFPVVEVIQRDQPISVDMVGETRGSSDVPIRARVDGFLESMSFVEGSNVATVSYTHLTLPTNREV